MAAAPIIKGATKGLHALANMLNVSPTKTVKKGKGKSGDVIEYILTDKQKEAGRKRNQAISKKLKLNKGGPQDPMPYVELEPDRGRLDQNILNVSENQGFGGTKPEDRDQNIVEKLVSSLLGRTIRFEDIPDDDPDIDQGLKSERHIAYPAGRPDLRMGGMTSRLGATTKFKKPLGMKGGGNITRAQRQRIARIMQDYKQKKARKSNGKRTNR